MKNNANHFLKIWALAIILVTVLLAGSFSFCRDDLGIDHSMRFDKKVSISQQNTHMPSQGNVDSGDPCLGGFCHLGHCSSLLVPTVAHFYIKISSIIGFGFLPAKPLDRCLEGPFQPPKFA